MREILKNFIHLLLNLELKTILSTKFDFLALIFISFHIQLQIKHLFSFRPNRHCYPPTTKTIPNQRKRIIITATTIIITPYLTTYQRKHTNTTIQPSIPPQTHRSTKVSQKHTITITAFTTRLTLQPPLESHFQLTNFIWMQLRRHHRLPHRDRVFTAHRPVNVGVAIR